MDGGSGAHGEAALLCGQGNPAASEGPGNLSGAEEAHTSRGGVLRSAPRETKRLHQDMLSTFKILVIVRPSPQMQSLCSSEDAMALLDHMETRYYELQLQLYDIQAEILQCEELLLTAQLDSIRRQMAGMITRFVFLNL